jgi:hypothetical protein
MENNITFTIVLTGDTTVEGILNTIKNSKQEFGLSTGLEDTLLNAEVSVVLTEEKKPWYKRFWNWITRKK